MKDEVKISEETRRRSLNYSIKDGIAWSVNEGLGNSYISPYAIALNANDMQVGLLTSVPRLVANFSQLETPNLMKKMSRKKIVTTFVLLQALTWLPILSIALIFLSGIGGLLAPTLLIIFHVFYLTFGSFLSPAWSSWMGDLVPENERGRFFGKRNEIIGLTALFSMIAAGFILDIFKKINAIFIGFVFLFLLAMVARLLSRYYLTKKYEPKLKVEEEYYFGFSQFVKRMVHTNFGRFTIYVAAMNFATNIAAPFFVVYMLRDLQFSYTTLAVIIMSSMLTNLLSMPLWGKFSDRYGNLKSLQICGLLVPLVPILWLFTKEAGLLIFIEMFSGIMWAGFNLSSSNFIYDAVTRQKRGLCFAYFNVINGLGVFIGATLGGLLAVTLKIQFMSVLLFLFLLSEVLRLAVSLAMLPKIREVRKVEPIRPLWFFRKEILHLR